MCSARSRGVDARPRRLGHDELSSEPREANADAWLRPYNRMDELYIRALVVALLERRGYGVEMRRPVHRFRYPPAKRNFVIYPMKAESASSCFAHPLPALPELQLTRQR